MAQGTKQAGQFDPVRILLVDDHHSVREAIAVALGERPGLEVTGQAATLNEARTMLTDIEVDVAVVDLGLADGLGTELIDDLRSAHPHARTLMLTADPDRAAVAEAIQRGASGMMSKTSRLGEVADAVRQLGAGKALLPMQDIVDLLRFDSRRQAREHDDRRALEALTSREVEVLQALADGLDTKAVAESFVLSIRTVRNHIANVLAKLGVHSQLQALVLALRYGVVVVRRG